MRVARERVETPSSAVVEHVPAPPGRNGLQYLSHRVVIPGILHDTQIGIDRGQERLHPAGAGPAVEPPDSRHRVANDPAADVYPPVMEAPPEEVQAGRGPLARELAWMNRAAKLPEPFPELVHHRQEGVLVAHHPPHVVHEAHVVKTVCVRHEVVKAVQHVVESVLPQQAAYHRADAVRLAEHRLVRRIVLPLMRRGQPRAPSRRICEHAPHEQVQQLVPVIPGIVLQHHLRELTVHYVLRGVGKVALQVGLYDPRLPAESLSNLADVLYEAVDGGVRAHADAVVEAAAGHAPLQQRAQPHVDMVVRYPRVVVRGEHLPRAGLAHYETEEGGCKVTVVDRPDKAHEVPLAMHPVHHAVVAAPLVRAARHISLICVFKRHFRILLNMIRERGAPLAVERVVVVHIARVVRVIGVGRTVAQTQPPGGAVSPSVKAALHESADSFLFFRTAGVCAAPGLPHHPRLPFRYGLIYSSNCLKHQQVNRLRPLVGDRVR